MLEDKAYNLVRKWRRGEINGNQFDFNLVTLGVSEEFCYGVAKVRDFEDLRLLAKETVILASICMIMIWAVLPVSAQIAEKPLIVKTIRAN